ncbi:hypothetical protein R1sor_010019 [Riccia sorocarpa]|uniref:Uncharacterized protein n=1 Tax=Riccia sorocarpa TaxID=122646 RepID=A0ABD3HWS8_9MARC
METLKAFNFGERFRRYIKAILENAASSILINASSILINGRRIKGSKVSKWEKSAARWIGPGEEDLPTWVLDLSWSWKHRGECTKLLGFAFEEGVQAEAMLLKCKRKRRLKGAEHKTVHEAFRKRTCKTCPSNAAVQQGEEKIAMYFRNQLNDGKLWKWVVTGKEKRQIQAVPKEEERTETFLELDEKIIPYKSNDRPPANSDFYPVEVIEFVVGQGKTWRIRAQITTERHES